MILLGNGQFHEVVDAASDELLMGQGLGKHVHGGRETCRRRLDGGQRNRRSLALDVFVDLHGVQHFFMVLHHEPVGEALQPHLIAMGRHGHVKIGRVHFPIDLLVQGFCHFVADHEIFLLLDGYC